MIEELSRLRFHSSPVSLHSCSQCFLSTPRSKPWSELLVNPLRLASITPFPQDYSAGYQMGTYFPFFWSWCSSSQGNFMLVYTSFDYGGLFLQTLGYFDNHYHAHWHILSLLRTRLRQRESPSVPSPFLCGWFSNVSRVKGLQMGVYSNSIMMLQALQWTRLPACVSMETQFVHAPLQLQSLTSISAEGHLA